MKRPQYLSWENFRSTVFRPGEQRVHRVTESPLIEVFGDGVANRIGLLIEAPSDTVIPPELSRLACVAIRTINQGGNFFIEVTTTAASLQRQFYHFSVAVAERVIVEKLTAIEAVGLELQCFSDLLEAKPLLEIERQIGLLGELVFLERLIARFGVRSLDAWIGPVPEPHDFRLELREFEVKTTVSTHRIHTIDGTEQLVASKGCKLYLVSVMLGPPGAGNGFSLAEKVIELSDLFSKEQTRSKQFKAGLEASGFREEDSPHYTRRFVMRRPIAFVLVDEKFPAITRPTIQNAFGSLATRIDYLRYDVNVEGLECEDGAVEFEAALGNLS